MKRFVWNMKISKWNSLCGQGSCKSNMDISKGIIILKSFKMWRFFSRYILRYQARETNMKNFTARGGPYEVVISISTNIHLEQSQTTGRLGNRDANGENFTKCFLFCLLIFQQKCSFIFVYVGRNHRNLFRKSEIFLKSQQNSLQHSFRAISTEIV